VNQEPGRQVPAPSAGIPDSTSGTNAADCHLTGSGRTASLFRWTSGEPDRLAHHWPEPLRGHPRIQNSGPRNSGMSPWSTPPGSSSDCSSWDQGSRIGGFPAESADPHGPAGVPRNSASKYSPNTPATAARVSICRSGTANESNGRSQGPRRCDDVQW